MQPGQNLTDHLIPFKPCPSSSLSFLESRPEHGHVGLRPSTIAHLPHLISFSPSRVANGPTAKLRRSSPCLCPEWKQCMAGQPWPEQPRCFPLSWGLFGAPQHPARAPYSLPCPANCGGRVAAAACHHFRPPFFPSTSTVTSALFLLDHSQILFQPIPKSRVKPL